MPIGTVIVKHFSGMSLGREVPLETRLIKRTAEGWEAATYAWNQALEKYDEIEAHLVPAGKQFEMYQRGDRQWNVLSWHAPSSSECASCHVDTAGFVLGLTTTQLNRDVNDKNQIAAWGEQGLVDLPANFDPTTAARFCDPLDDENSLGQRARVYLDVNCAMCHQPNGPGNANIDLRYATALDKTRMIDEIPAQGDMGNCQLKNCHARRSRKVALVETDGNTRRRVVCPMSEAISWMTRRLSWFANGLKRCSNPHDQRKSGFLMATPIATVIAPAFRFFK